jgi:O-antigen/teichoic acid export membrane protein
MTVEERMHDESRRRDLSTVARGGVLNLVGLVGGAIFNAALIIVVTHNLGRSSVGMFLEGVAFFNIVSSVTLWGADVGVVRQIPRLHVLGRRSDVRRTVLLAIATVFLAGLACAVVVEVGAVPIARVLVHRGSPERLATLLRILAPFVPIASAYAVAVAATRGFGTMRVSALVDKLGLSLAQPVFVVVAIIAGLGLVAVTAAWVAPTLVVAAIAGVWLERLIVRGERPGSDAAGAPSSLRELFVEFWQFAAPRGLAGVFAVAVLWLDTLLIGALRSPHETAVYTSATRFLVIGSFASLAIIQVIGPKLSQLLSAGHPDRAQDVYRAGTGWSMAVAWPIYWTMVVFAPVLLRVFPAGYTRAQDAVTILGLSMLVGSGTGPVDVVLLMGGRSAWNLFNTSVAVAANVGLNLLLIPRFGMTGAAIAWAASILANNVLPLIEVWFLLRIHPFGSGVRIVAAAASVCFGLVPWIARLLLGSTVDGFLVGEALGALLYVGILRVERDRVNLSLLWSSLRDRHGLGGRRRADASVAGTTTD